MVFYWSKSANVNSSLRSALIPSIRNSIRNSINNRSYIFSLSNQVACGPNKTNFRVVSHPPPFTVEKKICGSLLCLAHEYMADWNVVSGAWKQCCLKPGNSKGQSWHFQTCLYLAWCHDAVQTLLHISVSSSSPSLSAKRKECFV